MRFIQILLTAVFLTFALVSCNKDTTLNMETVTSKTDASTQSNDAHTGPKCGASIKSMATRLSDPTYKANQEKNKSLFENAIRTNTATSRAACSDPVVLPVAIHFQGVSSTDRACLVEVAQKSIVSTNKDFAGINNEISTLWDNDASSYYPDIIVGETCVEFQICLLYTSPSPRDATLSRMPSSA